MANSFLGMHFVFFPVGELQRRYEEQHIITEVVSIDNNNPLFSIVNQRTDDSWND